MVDISREHYITELKERRPEIAEFIASCERDKLTPQDYTAMRHCLRRLMELAEHHDAPLYQLAHTLRHALEQPQTADRISIHSLGKVLFSLCHAALTSTSSTQLKAFLPSEPFTSSVPTLLCIDDDRIMRAALTAMFGDHTRVLTAADGIEGLAMIRSHRPDLVLLDDTMPQMTGMKVIETMHADTRLSSIAVIMLTSSDRPQDIKRAMRAGAADYVVKPFDPHVLAQKVYGQLHRYG